MYITIDHMCNIGKVIFGKHTVEFEVNFFIKAVGTSHFDRLVNLGLKREILSGSWNVFGMYFVAWKLI